MLLCFFLTCISFILFLKSLSLKPLPLWADEMRFLSHWFWKELSLFPIYKVIKNSLCTYTFCISSKMSFKKKYLSKVENVEESAEMSVLDLPELALECILEKLPPDALCSMAGVCSSLRERCISDHLWEKHMKRKWGKVIGQAAYREWQWHLASRAGESNLKQNKQKSLIRLFSFGWSLSWIRSKVNDNNNTPRNFLPVDSIMAWYLALETGRFWFPAQVYNREVNNSWSYASICKLASLLCIQISPFHDLNTIQLKTVYWACFSKLFYLTSEVFNCAEWPCWFHVVLL